MAAQPIIALVNGQLQQVYVAPRRSVADVASTLAATDYLLAFSSLTATRAVALPSAASVGSATRPQYFIVKDESGSAGSFPITLTGTIDGATNKSISTAYGEIRIYSNGTAFFSW